MSIKVVARIRPLLKAEAGSPEIIVEALTSSDDTASRPNTIRLPNPRNPSENYSFQFNNVYDAQATQQEIFDNEST